MKKILYVASDIPVPHTGEFVGGSTHVLKIAESLAKRGNNVFIISRRVTRAQKKYEKISGNIFTRRVYRGLILPIQGKISSKVGEEKVKFFSLTGKVDRTLGTYCDSERREGREEGYVRQSIQVYQDCQGSNSTLFKRS